MKEAKKRIMIVDDEQNFTRFVKMNLEYTGQYEVVVSNESQSAFATAVRVEPDLFLLDVMMPGKDGGDLAAHLRAHPKLKSKPIIFITAAVKKEELVDHDGCIGGMPFIAKPVSFRELSKVIDNALPS